MFPLSASLALRQGAILVDLLALSGKMASTRLPPPTLNRQAFVFVLVRGGCGAKRSFVRPVRDAPIGFLDLYTARMLTTIGYL